MKTNKKQTLDYQAPTTEVVVLVSECVILNSSTIGDLNDPEDPEYE